MTASALLAVSVPATLAGEAPEPPAGAAAEALLDTITIDATRDSTKTGTVTLKRGTQYRLEVTGTMTVSGPYLYDAVYCYGERKGGTYCNPPRRICCIDGPGLSVRTSTGGGHVRIDCNQDAPDTCSNATDYRASHIYSVNYHPNNDGKLTAIVRNATSACDPAECGETTSGSFTIKIYGPGPAGGGGAELGEVTKPVPEPGESVKASSPEPIPNKARRADTSVTNSSGNLSGATVVADDKGGSVGEAVAACWLIGPDALNLPATLDTGYFRPETRKQIVEDFARLEDRIEQARKTGDETQLNKLTSYRFFQCLKLVDSLSRAPRSSTAAANGCQATRLQVVVQRNRRGRATGLKFVRRKPGKRDVRYSCAVDGPGAITVTADGRRRRGLRDGLGKKLDFGVVREPDAAPDSGRLTFRFGV